MARVLVTGATGFIGKNLVEAALAQNDDVACLVRSSSKVEPLEKLGVRLVKGDVTDPESLPGAVADVDVVYHLAGLTKAHNLPGYCAVNEMGVANVVEACALRNTPPVVVVLSSLAAAGPMAEVRPRTETDCPNPVASYGRSKRMGELAAEGLADKAPITVLRPSVVFGPEDVAGSALFRTIRRLGMHPVLGLGKRLALVYVTDLVAAILAAAQKGERLPAPVRSADAMAQITKTGQGYYFVAADECPTYAELGRMIGRAEGKPNVKVFQAPQFMLYGLAAGGELAGRITGRPKFLNLDRVREIVSGHWICSAEKAQRQLGFKQSAPLEEQLRQTAKWYEQAGWM